MNSSAPRPVPARVRDGSPNSVQCMDDWRREWLRSRHDPDGFWLSEAQRRLRWRTAPAVGLQGGYHSVQHGPFSWFADGRLNVTETLLEENLEERPDKTAILWEGDEPGDVRRLSYRELAEEVQRAANALKALGLRKGERVIIYMGMVPEAAVAMLACARLGAIHSVVFGGFSAEALRDRIRDCGAELVITQDEGLRGGRAVPLKKTADAAVEGEHGVRHMLVVKRTGGEVGWTEDRDRWWHEEVPAQSPVCEAVVCDAEDPLFILYTSGSTGRPKGVVHTCAGYLTTASYTHQTVFDLREDDVYGCVADVGWITGHTYIVYGPLANGATTLMFESTPLYPHAGRYWDMVERHRITIFYTAPTAIRALAAHGPELVRRYDRSSLRVLGTVGEPINPEAWTWYYDVVGDGGCNIVDTWWQTETGGIMISPVAPATPTAPGAATLPLPGVFPVLVDTDNRTLQGPAQGHLCIDHPWPGQARTVWGDHARYVATYFSTYPGRYFTGDGCRRNAQGYHWITGRVDDVLNISGHRMGTAEFESALVSAEPVAEAAVVGYPHPIKGQGVCAYIVLQPDLDDGAPGSSAAELNAVVRQRIGAVAKVDRFLVVPGLPKTRSGKVMRRILRKIAEGEVSRLGDTSTLADPGAVDVIMVKAGLRPETPA